jgi:VanZ family protein
MRATIIGFRIAVLALFGYWLVLFVATHIPAGYVEQIKTSDKLLHFGAFFVLAFLLAWAIPTQPARPMINVLLALAIAIGYAGVDELTQIPVGRHADWLDFIADSCGSIVGLVCYFAVRAYIISRGLRLFEADRPIG